MIMNHLDFVAGGIAGVIVSKLCDINTWGQVLTMAIIIVLLDCLIYGIDRLWGSE